MDDYSGKEADAVGRIANIPFGKEGDFMEQSDNAAPQNNKKKRNTAGIVIAAVTVCAAVSLVFLIVLIIRNFTDKARAGDIYGEAADFFEREVAADVMPSAELPEEPTVYDRIKEGESFVEGAAPISPELAAIRAKITSLKQKNPDVVGWIKVDGTKINYPLMRSADGNDEYYLDHAYTGEYNSLGSIFMVSECDELLERNYNTVIYGHNVVNGAMFHDVMKFFDASFFASETVKIYTLNGEYIYKPFAVYQTRSDYEYIRTYFGGVEQFLKFCAEMKGNSEVPSDVTMEEGDTMITLSTCTATGYVTKDRITLQAKLIEVMR